MATTTVSYTPETGRQVITLASWSGSASFTATPVAGDQVEYPSTLTVGTNGAVSGADGSYTLRLVQSATGTTEGVGHVIGTPDTTAPTLTNPSVWPTGQTTLTAAVETNEANGVLYALASVNATESAATVKTGTSQSVLVSGPQTVPITGLTPAPFYYVHFLHEDAANNASAVVTSGQVALPPAGTITLGTPTVTDDSITLPFTYSGSDHTGFQYRLGGGVWVATTSPVQATGLTDDTPYTVEVRAINTGGGGTPANATLTTAPGPEQAQTTVTYAAPTDHTVATLGVGFDNYVFQAWPAGEPTAGWQLLTVTAEGYFDAQGNYWFEEGTESIHDLWVVEPDGTVTKEVVDNTGLQSPLQGEITVDTPTVGRTSATIPFNYSAADADGFEYRLDGGAWTQVLSPISLSNLDPETQYTVDVRAYNAATQSVHKTVTFTTAAAVDTTPNAFSFTPQTGVARSVPITSNTITVSGVDAGVDVPISIGGDATSEYSVSTDGGSTWDNWTSTAGVVRLNYQVRVRHQSSDEYSSGGYDGVRNTALSIGGITGNFPSTTLADTTAPVITLTGGNITVTQGSTWTEPGYSAIDAADGDISVSGVVITGAVDTNALGQYSITYTATDRSGNSASATRIVTVVESVPDDQIAPVISLVGGNRTLLMGEPWVDPGYSAVDNFDGNLTGDVTITGSVDSSQPGTYLLTYRVSDYTGNMATATRVVTVVADLELGILAPYYRTIVPEFTAYGGAAAEVFYKAPMEQLDYDIDLADWLTAENDSILLGTANLQVQVADNTGLVVGASGYMDVESRIKLWLSGGRDGTVHTVSVFITTALGRRKKFIFRLATRAFW